MSETLLDTQELQYPSHFSTASSSSAWDDTENLQRKYQPYNPNMKHHWILRN